MSIDTFYYDAQIKRYLVQVSYVFSGLNVMVGKSDTRDERLIPVPIHYGSRDRVVQHIIGSNTQNKPLRLPVLAAYMSSLDIAPELYKGKMTQRSQTYLPRGGVVPDDLKVVRQYMPIPFRMSIDVSMYCSNQEQQFQILEQILMLFDPTLQIQTSDQPFDWTKITTIKLEDIRFEENYPPSIERRIIQTTLSFSLPIYIAPPSTLKANVVNKVLYRISTMDNSDNIEDIVGIFDEMNLEYETLIDMEEVLKEE